PWGGDCSRPNLRCTQAFLYMAHGLGHGIGLEVHDVGGHSYSPTGVFQEGEVITIEPGLYIGTHLLDMLPDTPKNRAFIAAVRPAVERYANIGVRIEDDYIVTATGVEWISRAPREIEEIEAVMPQRPGTWRGPRRAGIRPEPPGPTGAWHTRGTGVWAGGPRGGGESPATSEPAVDRAVPRALACGTA